ncbi:hypothetical protein FQA39_LY06969 [Lamprigera yunnana]|nr:hypothetical protein FQA39_LY06969 [Lamprigera yunnana]
MVADFPETLSNPISAAKVKDLNPENVVKFFDIYEPQQDQFLLIITVLNAFMREFTISNRLFKKQAKNEESENNTNTSPLVINNNTLPSVPSTSDSEKKKRDSNNSDECYAPFKRKKQSNIRQLFQFFIESILPLASPDNDIKDDIQRKDDFCQEYNFNNRLIYARKYGGLWAERLCYPTQRFDESFRDTQKIIANQLKNEPHIQDLSIQIVNHIKENVNFDYINCSPNKDSRASDVKHPTLKINKQKHNANDQSSNMNFVFIGRR